MVLVRARTPHHRTSPAPKSASPPAMKSPALSFALPPFPSFLLTQIADFDSVVLPDGHPLCRPTRSYAESKFGERIAAWDGHFPDKPESYDVDDEEARRRNPRRGQKRVSGNIKFDIPFFTITLDEAEIDLDLMMMTRSMRPFRPKKRSKLRDKALDAIFPGSWLAEMTPAAYKAYIEGL